MNCVWKEKEGSFCFEKKNHDMSSRPELQAPPEIFYDDAEARKYTSSSRIIQIQGKLTKRALELLALPDDGVPKLLLDIGRLRLWAYWVLKFESFSDVGLISYGRSLLEVEFFYFYFLLLLFYFFWIFGFYCRLWIRA